MKNEKLITLPLDTKITCPIEPTHVFPLKDGLAGETLKHLVEESANKTKRELDRIKANLAASFEEQLKDERQRAEAEIKRARESSSKSLSLELENLRADKKAMEDLMSDLRKDLTEKAKSTVALKNTLEELRAAQDAKVAEALTEFRRAEREKLSAEANNRIEAALSIEREKMNLQLSQLERQKDQAIKAAEDLKRRMEQSSQQAQGESLELDLEEAITVLYPSDDIAAVPKGITGADIIHEVRSTDGRRAGAVAIEIKSTKSFSHGWVAKLKEDKVSVGADVGLIVTATMPEGMSHFGEVDGIWICSISCWRPVLTAIRAQLIAIHRTRSTNVAKDQKLELLYRYLTGPEFRGRVQIMVDKFQEMRDQLERERRALTRHWAKREKMLATVTESISTVYGDLQGTIGAQSLPEVESLALETENSDES